MSKAASSKGFWACACRAACPRQTTGDESLFTRIKDALIDVRTWSSMLYLLLMLPLGIAYFTTAVTGMSFSLGLTGGALWGLVSNESTFQIGDLPWLDHLLHTAPGLMLAAITGRACCSSSCSTSPEVSAGCMDESRSCCWCGCRRNSFEGRRTRRRGESCGVLPSWQLPRAPVPQLGTTALMTA